MENFGYKAGFLVHATSSLSDEVDLLQTTQESKACLLDTIAEGDFLVDIASPQKWEKGVSQEITIPKEGLYDVLFVRCTPDPGYVTFNLGLTMYNPGPDYLSAGEAPLPTLYLLFSLVAFGMLGAWVWYLRRHATKVVHLHRMMAVLIFFKAMSLLFESITMHFVAARGEPVGWNVVYYIFAFLKGVTLFVVILLVGTGWTLLKPFLNEREKKLFLVVLPMQVLANIALVVVADKAPGSVAYARWSDVLHIVDLLCCAAVLAPIFWSITHLRQASGADGKARDTLVRLTQFRQFYLMVVCYIYFTRIIVWILVDTVPFNLAWLGAMAEESATLVFYIATAWKFRPNSDNPYVKVRGEDDEEDEAEFGLEDDEEAGGARGVEMRANPAGAGAGAGAGGGGGGNAAKATPAL